MPDTSSARKAIHAAYDKRRDVNGGLSMAELKLEAAGGLLRDDDPLPYAEDDPVWIEHALTGMRSAHVACGERAEAIRAATAEVERLHDTEPHCHDHPEGVPGC